jgi:hypothetical protein
LNEKAKVGDDGRIPSQRNTGRVEFTIKEDGKGNLVAEIGMPRFLDTSQIDVDIHPTWLQVLHVVLLHVHYCRGYL